MSANSPSPYTDMRIDDLLAQAASPYDHGYLAGLYAWAWWKDGTMYVGSTGTTLQQAMASYLAERDRRQAKSPVAGEPKDAT